MASASDLARVSKAQVLNLTTTGRKTGLSRTIEIWFAASGEMVYIMSGAGPKSNWVQNLVLNPTVTLAIEGKAFHGRARPLERRRDRPAWALAQRLFQEKYDWTIEAGVLPVEAHVQASPSPQPG
ncbi:MAG: nitroreductase family deazaflavin-dependent oxidoreductase [Dehalococcoidia bacterium]|nr:nitroreductase family deazaflavin-dependent oxidoreductase [Dehalococcoidia bacterium]